MTPKYQRIKEKKARRRERILNTMDTDALHRLKQYVNEFPNDEEVWLKAVSRSAMLLKKANENIKKNKQIIFAALNSKKFANYVFHYISADLKKDTDFILEAINHNSIIIQDIDDSVWLNRDLAITLIKENPNVVCQFVYKEEAKYLFEDREIIGLMYKKFAAISKNYHYTATVKIIENYNKFKREDELREKLKNYSKEERNSKRKI